MQLKSFGCSFIFGTDLADDNTFRSSAMETAFASNNTWPALLARHLGRDYSCHARPGSGNLQILEQVLNHAASGDNTDLFVISWSWIDRFDYYNPDHGDLAWHIWHTLTPGRNDSLAQNYYKNLHSEYRDKLTSLGYVKLAIDTLTQKGIPFLMTYMDNLLMDQQWHTTPAVLSLQEYIKPFLTQFEGQTFLDWSRAHGYPESAGWHPLEAAHAAAFELVKDYSFS